ncbi:uncharacterized protein [Paralichthys olivaceus]|uniref:uncharacterized protein isoform X2 n=1 Tax=Paralichthys olivaceus TaxID=8255 RepID=UPI0037538575
MLVSLLLLLLAAAAVHAGDFYEEQYGSTIRIRMRGSAHSLIFVPRDGSESVILWKLNDPSFSTYRRGVINGYLVINNLTQRDNGEYRMMGRNDKLLLSHKIAVVAQYKNFDLNGQELLRFTFPLESKNCNIHFLPDKQEYTKYDTELVRSGRKVNTWSSCTDFEFVEPCGLEMEMHELCHGHFEVRDQYDGVALSVQVNWMGEPFNLGHIGTSIGAFLASIFFCCCVRRCCCGKSSKKKDSDSAATEPAVTYNEYRNEPVALRSVQMLSPSETLYPAQPSCAPTGPLVSIHNPPTVNVPPAYSEVSAPAEQEHTPSFSLSSDSDLRFELKGMNISSAPPLSSDPTYNSVYTSNKLNFL